MLTVTYGQMCSDLLKYNTHLRISFYNWTMIRVALEFVCVQIKINLLSKL